MLSLGHSAGLKRLAAPASPTALVTPVAPAAPAAPAALAELFDQERQEGLYQPPNRPAPRTNDSAQEKIRDIY
jgi:hypothetical protein